MRSSPERYWLARDGHTHGPYEVGELSAMDGRGELLDSDSFCLEGGDAWLTRVEWRRTVEPPLPRKQTVIRPVGKSATGPKPTAKSGKTNPPPRLLATLPRKNAGPPSTGNGGAAPLEVVPDMERRISRMVEAVNEHRRVHPHRHPFYFAEPQHLAEVVGWLDQKHPGWDRAANFGGANALSTVLNEWFIPAVALVKPDLLKPSHRTDFGEGRPWRDLDSL